MKRTGSGLALLVWLATWAAPAWGQARSEKDELFAALARVKAARARGDLAAAALHYERAADLAPRVFRSEPEKTSNILNNLADVCKTLGRFDRSEALYRQSLAIREERFGKDHLEVAASLNNLGNLYADMGRYEQAEALHRRALEIREARLGKDHLEVAASLDNLGNVYADMGRHEQAGALLRRALEIREARQGKDHLDVANSLNNLGVLYAQSGQYEQAEAAYRRSLEIKEARLGKDHPDVALALNNLANVYQDMGRFDLAEPLHLRSLEIRQARLGREDPVVAESLHNLATLYKETRRYPRAEPLFLRSLAIYQARFGKDHIQVAKGLHNLANLCQATGRSAEAERLYRRTLEIKEANLGKDHPAVADVLENLGGLQRALGRPDEAERTLRRCLEIREARLAKDNVLVAGVLNNLANIYRDSGRHEEAGPLYRRSLEISEARLGKDHPDVARTLYNLARLEAGCGKWDEAAALTERSRRVVRRHVSRVLSALPEQDQLAYLQGSDELFFQDALSVGLARRTDAALAAQSAGWLLNGKGITQEVLAQRTLLAGAGGDPRTATLAGQLKEARRELARRTLAKPPAGQEQAHLRALAQLTEREQELSRRLGEAAGRPGPDDPWVGLEEVRRALPAEAVLVEIARFEMANFAPKKGQSQWQGARFAAWIIPPAGRGEVQVIDLGEAGKIDRAVQAARKALEAASATVRERGEPDAEKEVGRPLEELSRLVLHPLLEHIGASKQWVLSPDAALWLVPWAALPLPGSKYAVEEHAIRYVVSGRDLAALPVGGTPGRPRMVADPDYDLAPAEALAQATRLIGERNPTELRGRLPGARVPTNAQRLPGTAVEAAAVKPRLARYAGEEPWVYLRTNALEAVVKAFKAPRVLTLSTHGYFLPSEERKPGEDPVLENPLLRCGLLLAGCNQRDRAMGPRDEDGVLTGLEILEMDLRGTELVVLSACETGLGDVRGGEGVAGLRQAFQLAGARAVVATLWQIPDRETARLMNDFFAHLAEGQDKAEALRRAQLKLIESRRQRDGAAHPLFWAAFTLTGQGS